MFDYIKYETCTAVFNFNDWGWKQVLVDDRIARTGGSLLGCENILCFSTVLYYYLLYSRLDDNKRILYLGGFNFRNEKLKTVYELESDDKWVLWSEQLLHPLANDTMVPIPTDVKCQEMSMSISKK